MQVNVVKNERIGTICTVSTRTNECKYIFFLAYVVCKNDSKIGIDRTITQRNEFV